MTSAPTARAHAAGSGAPAILHRTGVLVQPVLRAAVAQLDAELAAVAGYHLGWVDADGRPSDAGGKGLRGALAVLSAEAVGAGAGVGLTGAVAVELVHNYSLLHDDVIDGDRERRHRPTVWALHGVGTAIVLGDALLNLGIEVLADQPYGPAAVAELVAANGAMIAGQLHDMAYESRRDVTLAESVAMAERKTGALLACSACIGAVLAGAPARQSGSLRDFGRHLGLAFQAVDDLLGIWGDPERTGKPRGSDLASAKKSIPVTAALAGTSAAANELRRLLRAAPLDANGCERAAELVEEAGGRSETTRIADRALRRALEALDSAELAPRPAAELRELARFTVDRER